ncbi:hypothetical protein HYU93_03160 [Candidatus Daviesbacteria bacterium]|nr:hypothetical protein [Candidatus Daviesbacteria bacterium]
MDFTYILILAAVLAISPFILKLAASQKKETKRQLKFIFLFLLIAQVFLGFFNWENFSIGRSGFNLSLTYPNSLLGSFFIVSFLQILFLTIMNKSFNTLVVVLNFINTILIFTGMVRLSSILGFQAVSFYSIVAVFLVLVGNVIGLACINKDKNLLKKYP